MTSGSTGPAARRPGIRSRLSAAAPAKINLVLEVGPRRPDGFHELRSTFAPLELADTLSVSIRGGDGDELSAPGSDTLSIDGPADVPVQGNLVLRAATLLRAETSRPLPALAFRLRKRIPAAAGLGGGSSDALAALDLAAAAWGLRLPVRRRVALAAELGSDVPFFAIAGWALVRGRGERLRRLPAPTGGRLGVLLVVPAARLSTREVFAAFDASPGTNPQQPESRAGSTPHGAASRLARRLREGAPAADVAAIQPANDLLPAAEALMPGLARLRRDLAEALGRPVHLTGSGPTLAVLYPSPRQARSAREAVLDGLARGALIAPGGSAEVIPTATVRDGAARAPHRVASAPHGTDGRPRSTPSRTPARTLRMTEEAP